jgi:hypothetical protein
MYFVKWGPARIAAKALRELKDPSRSRKLRSFLDNLIVRPRESGGVGPRSAWWMGLLADASLP